MSLNETIVENLSSANRDLTDLLKTGRIEQYQQANAFSEIQSNLQVVRQIAEMEIQKEHRRLNTVI